MFTRFAVCIALSASAAVSADWNPKLAAQYLDARQQEWFSWPTANSNAKPCISCHTGMTYLMARPALRKSLGESAPTEFETGLLKSLRDRVARLEPAAGAGLGVESVMAALFLSADGPAAPRALDRLWELQVREGKSKGSWNWFSLDLDPWEMPESNFYGAALAAMAVGGASADYRARPEVKSHVAELAAFLRSGADAQPLHNRLMLLWASAKLPEALPAASRAAIVRDAWKQQQPDGGWSMESLGPFKAHAKAPRDPGGNAYATAFAAYVLRQADGGNPQLSRALDWLRAHQDAHDGSWSARSMNKEYPPGSMESRFMSDAATAFAAMALLNAEPRP